jgi:hypothetical protein
MEQNEDNSHIPYIQNALTKLSKTPDSKLTPAAIKLRRWLINNKMTVPQLALRTGFNPTTFYNYLSGQARSYPSLAQAFAIEWVTGGEVQAWEWLDNPYIERQVRNSQVAGTRHFEVNAKSFVLKYNNLKTVDGVIRHKARMLSRLFGVNWGEVKKRIWEEARVRAK